MTSHIELEVWCEKKKNCPSLATGLQLLSIPWFSVGRSGSRLFVEGVGWGLANQPSCIQDFWPPTPPRSSTGGYMHAVLPGQKVGGGHPAWFLHLLVGLSNKFPDKWYILNGKYHTPPTLIHPCQFLPRIPTVLLHVSSARHSTNINLPISAYQKFPLSCTLAQVLDTPQTFLYPWRIISYLAQSFLFAHLYKPALAASS